MNRQRNCMRSPHILFILFHTNRRTLYNFILLFTSSTAHQMFRPEFSSLSRTTDNGLWWNLCSTRNVITWLLNNLIESNEKCMNASNNDSIKSYTHTHTQHSSAIYDEFSNDMLTCRQIRTHECIDWRQLDNWQCVSLPESQGKARLLYVRRKWEAFLATCLRFYYCRTHTHPNRSWFVIASSQCTDTHEDVANK